MEVAPMAARKQTRDVGPNRTKIWLGVIGVFSAIGVVAVPVILNRGATSTSAPEPASSSTPVKAELPSIKQTGDGQIGIATGNGDVIQNQFLPPADPPKPDVQLGAVRVVRNSFRQPSTGSSGMIDDLGSSSVLDVILINKGTGTAVVTGVRFTCIEYREKTAEFGGDDLLNPTAKYSLDLASLKSAGAKVELPIAHELKGQASDRLMIVATDSSRKNWQEKTTATWQLRVEFLTTAGELLESKEVAIKIPADRPPRGSEETAPAMLPTNGLAVVPAPPSGP